jgi:hypothetical protein
MGGGALALLGALVFVAIRLLGGGARIESAAPPRVKVGQTVTFSGDGFDPDPAANVVLFGEKPGAVLQSSPTRLHVQVPELAMPAGQDVKVSVRVRVRERDSRRFEITVFGGPTLHGISPDLAMPGDQIVLAGMGWGAAPAVRFGETPAEVLQATANSIRVRVPEIAGGPGTAAPVVVLDGPARSNEAPFYVGRIPLILRVEPTSAAPGDLVTVTGRGFRRDPREDAVTLGGVRALVVSAVDSELRVIVPYGAVEGRGGLDLRVVGSENVAQAPLSLLPPGDPVDFRFAAQVFDVAPGREHAVLVTGLGPAFVLASSGGKTAAERAALAERRLNEAGAALKASRDVDIELRNPMGSPALALSGRPDVLLEVTEEDAAAYNEDWTGLKGRGGPVTRIRLAQWWTAVARDLVLMLVRGAKAEYAPGLAPEGRVLLEVFQAAQKMGRFGVPSGVVAGLKPAQREALRLVALRVPPSLLGPGGATAASGPVSSASGLKLDGLWIGTESEGGQRRYISAEFARGGGVLSHEGAVTVTMPLLSVDARKDGARFSLQFRGGLRYYLGKWDGQALSGKIASDPGGADAVGTFELKPR